MFNVLHQEGFYALMWVQFLTYNIKVQVLLSLMTQASALLTPQNVAFAVAKHMQVGKNLGRITHGYWGALVPEKCFWYLINFAWRAGKWYYKNSSQQPAVCQVQNAQ